MGGGLMQLSERLNEMADAHKGMISAPLIMKGGSRRARTHRRTRRGGMNGPAFAPHHVRQALRGGSGGGRKKVARTHRRTRRGGGRKKVAMTNRRTKKGGLFYFPRPRSHGF